MTPRRICVALVALAISTSARPAAGQPTHGSMAQTLFDEAKGLMAEGNYPAACAKLSESYRLDPRSGTQINLAACHEKEGRLATSWVGFREALARATAERRPDRKRLAEERLRALEPRLPKLRIDAAEGVSDLADLTIQVDGAQLGAAILGSANPLDPGTHRVTASAPGRQSFEATVELKEGALSTLVIDLPVAPATEPPGPAEPPAPAVSLPSTRAEPAQGVPSPSRRPVEAAEGRMQRIVGWSMLGAGSASLAAGTVALAVAVVDARAADAVCTATTCPDDESLARNDRARVAADVATGTLIAGAVVATTGVIVALLAPREERALARVAPMSLRWSF
jgi:hypothetical protein